MSWWYEDGLTIYDYDKDKGWQYRHVKEERMEFDRSRVYTALNADELRAGDKVFVADQLSVLKKRVQEGKEDSAIVLQEINGEDWGRRFGFTMYDFALAYLVERAENCTNCENKDECPDYLAYIKNDGVRYRCEDWKPKTKKEIDMWNYTSEKLPTRQEIGVSDRVVVAIKGYNTVDVGYYDYELEAWFVDGNRYPVPVYAWMAIKPPREA